MNTVDEKTKATKRRFYLKHKSSLREKERSYNRIRKRLYRQKNKATEYRYELCECGIWYQFHHKRRHEQTQRHSNRIAGNAEETANLNLAEWFD